MKPAVIAWLASWISAANVLATTGHVYISGSSRPNAHTLSPPEAQLVIAHQLGLAESFQLNGISKAALDAMNELPKTRSLFHRNQRRSRAVIIVEDSEEIQQSDNRPFALLTDSPALEENAEFLQSLRRQMASSGIVDYLSSDGPTQLASLRVWMKSAEHTPRDAVFHFTPPETTASVSSREQAREKQLQLQNNILHLSSSVSPSVDLVVIFSPRPRRNLFGLFQNTGSWQLPTLFKRQLRDEDDLFEPSVVRPDNELIGDEDEFDTGDDEELFPDVETLQNKTFDPPRGILAACYLSRSSCETVTRDCSGHGTCVESYRADDSSCFSCSCKSTREERGNGKYKTTVWTGPACQKKDISAPFWLLGGTAVILASVVASGIGLLYSMGSQELPSVIGAGVAGPRAK